MIDRVREMSLSEGYNKSRLPEFTDEEIRIINGSYEFLGLNHYSSDKVYFASDEDGEHPSHWRDVGVIGYQDDSWESSAASWLKVAPFGLRKLLVWVKENYGNPPILITENGYADVDGLSDYGRANYMKDYLYEVLRAIHEHDCNVIGYTAWSLMDNFEWMAGYTLVVFYYDKSNDFRELCINFSSQRFGLHYVDFDDPDRPRTPKLSSYVYKNIIETRHIDWDYYPILN